MGKDFRCPNCNEITSPQAMMYSEALDAFVCPRCHMQASVAAQRTDDEVDFTPQAEPHDATRTPVLVRHTSAWVLPTIGLACAAIIITLLAIWIFRAPPTKPVDQQRAWEDSNHARIVQLKSEAEALALDGQLASAHAKYRELERLVGGRKVKDASLFDIVEVARQDQDRIYKLMLQRMEESLQQPAAATSEATPADQVEVEMPPPPQIPPGVEPPAPIEAPQQSYGASFDALRGVASDTTITPPIPAETASTEPAAPLAAAEIIPMPRGPVTDEQIGSAIQRGVDFLLSQFGPDGAIIPGEQSSETYKAGLDALAVYALAASGRAIVDPRLGPRSPEMERMLDKLKEYELDARGEIGGPVTYARSLRACALAVYNRAQDRDVLRDDVDWLVNAAMQGAYTYDARFAPPRKSKIPQRPATPRAPARSPRADAALSDGDVTALGPQMAQVILTDGVFTPRPPPPPLPEVLPRPPSSPFTNTLPARQPTPPNKYNSPFPWDNSNSQYGLLGVWAGSEAGVEVPTSYWREVDTHWKSHQVPSGEWYYSQHSRDPRFTMTCAALASLLVTHDYLEAPLLASPRTFNREPYSPQVRAGLAWLEEADHSVNIMAEPLFYVGYNLFSLERVGLASGLKHFGGHDWFVELAAKQLKTQWPNGAFGSEDRGTHTQIDTAFTLLFLSRGRHPLMMNKLRFDGYWSNRPREIANLAAFASRELERTLNWQVVDIQREPWEWQDSPILYIASHKALSFDADQMAKLSEFVDDGGIIFTHADIASEEFNRSVASLAKQLFPAYELKDLPPDHALFKLNYTITSKPRIQAVSNGSRLLLVHSGTDLSRAWQTRSLASQKEAYQLGVNLYLYATGKERFRNRLDTPTVFSPTQPPRREIPLARLKYQGNWDPEPRAWARFERKFHWDTGDAPEVKLTPIDELSIDRFRIAHLTGTDAFTPTDAQLAAMKAFVEAGGTLLIDACGGSGKFADAEHAWLPKLLGAQKLETLPPEDALFKKTVEMTVDAPSQALRLYALEELRSPASRIKSATVGKGRVVFSGLDISSGLLGTNTWGILGYIPEFSEAVVHNLVVLSSHP